jgi:hypothetical protein
LRRSRSSTQNAPSKCVVQWSFLKAILSSTKVVETAERIARKILDTYLEPDKSFMELREMVNSGSVNLIREFSEACRAEFETLRIA